MKSEVVLAILKSFLAGDRDRAIELMRQLEAGELQGGRTTLASRLRRMLDSQGNGQLIQLPNKPPSIQCYQPARRFDDLVIDAATRTEFEEFVAEWQAATILREHGLSPRSAVLLRGPSGNGKTALAQAIANAMKIPLAVVQLAATVDSFRGATGRNVRDAFNFAGKTPCVLFFDEADSIVSARHAGARDSGKEDNRTVNEVLMCLDEAKLGPSPTIFATNFADDLDSALLRRIGLTVELPPPTPAGVTRFARVLEERWPVIRDHQGWTYGLNASSYAAIESAAECIARRSVLSAHRSAIAAAPAEREAVLS